MTHDTKYDIVLRGGRIVDGTGAPWYVADVGIQNGKIAKIGHIAAEDAKTLIDASGLIVAPGFIDMMGQIATPMVDDPKTAIDRPLVRHHLARLRASDTPTAEFRALVQRLAVLLAYEATKDLQLENVKVQTPLTTTAGQVLKQRIGLVPILRAGLGMVDPVLDLIPTAEVWHLGLYRDEQTAQPVEYYSKLPSARPVDVALVLDPMLATGGSAASALAALRRWRVPTLKLLSLIAAPEGIAALEAQLPDAQVYVCAIDERLNDQKFIVPGLGDAGDRSFNTVPFTGSDNETR